jgi:flagellar secretion chaperone FliS
MQQGYGVYEHAHVTTADRGRLLLMLYEGAINFLREAERRMREGEEVKARTFQGKAFRIITELMNTLNHEVGGEIASNLHRLYTFMLHHLSEGNLRKNSQHFDDVARLLLVLHDAFAQAVTTVARPTIGAHRKVMVGVV